LFPETVFCFGATKEILPSYINPANITNKKKLSERDLRTGGKTDPVGPSNSLHKHKTANITAF
jgi:hypothetical protein